MSFNKSQIASIEIFPPIAIARVGDSDEWYVAPDVPGVDPIPKGGVKDSEFKVKRCAARFRLYAFDSAGKVLGEIDATDPSFDVTWSVRVANKKSAWIRDPSALRNPSIQPWAKDAEGNDIPDVAHTDNRTKLIIDSGDQFIRGPNATPAKLEGDFYGLTKTATKVQLGEVRTDEAGRLIVVPGDGRAWTMDKAADDLSFLNGPSETNDWVDTMCDGHVTVKVVASDSGNAFLTKNRATIIAAPPHFSTDFHCPTTLYELIEDIYENKQRVDKGSKYDVGQVDYYKHIDPIFRRMYVKSQTDASTKATRSSHLSHPRSELAQVRKVIFAHLSQPPVTVSESDRWAPLTDLQIARLGKWADGDFVTGTSPAQYKSFADIPIEEQPSALTFSALEWSLGAPLYPGIECSWVAKLSEMYDLDEPFRFSEKAQPGHLSRGLTLPWHVDFNMCNTHWWPSVRPDNMATEKYFLEIQNMACNTHWWPALPSEEVMLKAQADACNTHWWPGLPTEEYFFKAHNDMCNTHWWPAADRVETATTDKTSKATGLVLSVWNGLKSMVAPAVISS